MKKRHFYLFRQNVNSLYDCRLKPLYGEKYYCLKTDFSTVSLRGKRLQNVSNLKQALENNLKETFALAASPGCLAE